MNEDITRRLPDRPNSLEELVRLVQSFSTEITDLRQTVEALKQTVEARLHDTRPIWEKVQADIAQLQEGQQRIEERLEALRDDTRTGLRNLKRDFGILNDTFMEIRGEYRDLDRRVYRLEEPQS